MMVVREMWLLQKGLYEGTRACWRPFVKEHGLVRGPLRRNTGLSEALYEEHRLVGGPL
jgi:hypothetical protein